MRKLCITAALLAACAVCLVAQEGAALLDLKVYSSYFLNSDTNMMSRKYTSTLIKLKIPI
jgi:hypothetical protein